MISALTPHQEKVFLLAALVAAAGPFTADVLTEASQRLFRGSGPTPSGIRSRLKELVDEEWLVEQPERAAGSGTRRTWVKLYRLHPGVVVDLNQLVGP